jgi:FdhD protein
MPRPVIQHPIHKLDQGQYRSLTDTLAVEEPLEIRLSFGPTGQREERPLSITMRTPGDDHDLVAGFLFTEGLIGQMSDIAEIRHTGQALHPESEENIILATLHPQVRVDFEQLSRHFYTSSSCGVCGKSSIEMVRQASCYFPRKGHPQVTHKQLLQLPAQLRAAQAVFQDTGGIHAAALFGEDGRLLIREDVGRHNALDKLIGAALAKGMIPLREHLLLLSGRISFELVQKALMAGIPIVAAMGAPSSLAVALAEENGMTLAGFLSQDRFNLYCGKERVVL